MTLPRLIGNRLSGWSGRIRQPWCNLCLELASFNVGAQFSGLYIKLFDIDDYDGDCHGSRGSFVSERGKNLLCERYLLSSTHVV